MDLKFIKEKNSNIRALQKLKKSINSSFNNAVIQISRCQSKVVLCGVGKSGLIASKIAANTIQYIDFSKFNSKANLIDDMPKHKPKIVMKFGKTSLKFIFFFIYLIFNCKQAFTSCYCLTFFS